MGNYSEFRRTYEGNAVLETAAEHFEELMASLGKDFPVRATMPVTQDHYDSVAGGVIYDGINGIHRIHLQLGGYIKKDSQTASIVVKIWHKEEAAINGLRKIVDDTLRLRMAHTTFPIPTGKFPRIPKSELTL